MKGAFLLDMIPFSPRKISSCAEPPSTFFGSSRSYWQILFSEKNQIFFVQNMGQYVAKKLNLESVGYKMGEKQAVNFLLFLHFKLQ